MKIAKFLFKRETRAPMLALTLATLVSTTLVGARILWTGNVRYSFLVWNLFLAWLPFLFALLAHALDQRNERRDWRFAGLAAAWLLFFPNAPYIFTDVIHLTGAFHRHFWVDLSLVLLCALTGLVLGFVSLYLMQAVVTRRFGRALGWCFTGGAAALGGFGIYLGRFLRFNSWDVVARPLKLSHSIGAWVADPASSPVGLAFPVLFALFLFLAYVMLYALTHLPQLHVAPAPAGRLQAGGSAATVARCGSDGVGD